MNVLDILLIAAAIGFALLGYRNGFVVAASSVLGFAAGAALAAGLLPLALRPLGLTGTTAAVVAVVAVILVAALAQALTTHLAGRLRRTLAARRPSPSARRADAAGGAAVYALAVLVVAWLLGAALAGTSLPTVSKEVRSSRILGGVENAMPTGANSWFSGLGASLARSGFPQVFQPFENEPIEAVPPPDPKLAHSAALRSARRSIVKVQGTATGCGKVLEGSGFVYAPHRIVTNAHVVGGVREPTVQVGGTGRLYDAQVVLYDWRRDVAVLDVPGLPDGTPALALDRTEESPQSGAIVVGFPENGGFDARPARIRQVINARGPDVYRRGSVTRRVYSLYATVRQGNSGGPLLRPDGRVAGLIFAKSLDDAETGYALTYGEVARDLQDARTRTAPVDTQGCAK
ncbi:serine protease [Mangrovactinospora gilvigrisea]|uniref:Serine protease n=1 Tax=Mangrovactinospora gilvigrisea TaxID=1428644 RepID=A0A1J7C8I4_9ACTN|nr:MarP family serine protease [Mangrovactinospora gilvigrisea]OIV37844.1 serine protease [Mangrovactinospora gilvigrisea]